MMTISPNPGFVLLLAGLLTLILPARLRFVVMTAAPLAAIWLMFSPPFGEEVTLAQVGLAVTPLRLDALSQVFGLAFAIVTTMLALASGARRDRLEDSALMAQAGGAICAVFAGDIITFAAAAGLAGFGGVLLTAAGRTPDARAAALRMGVWQALAGMLLAIGAGLIWARSHSVDFDVLEARKLGGAVYFVALLILSAGPVAHVWLKDAAPRALPIGAAALAALAPTLGIYGLLRAFGGEPALVWIGVVLALWPLPYAALATDLRRALACGAVSQIGCMMIGAGGATFLATSGAAAMAFAYTLQTTISFLTIGNAYKAVEDGPPGANEVGGLARTMPVSALTAMIAGLSAMATPAFAGFAGFTVVSAALSQEGRIVAWFALAAASVGAVVHAGLRAPFEVFFGTDKGARPAEAPFATRLGLGLAAFLIVAIGIDPAWLYGLLPEQIAFHAYDGAGPFSRLQIVVFAVLGFAVVGMLRLYPRYGSGDSADTDWLYRGPLRVIGAFVVRAAGWCDTGLIALGDASFKRMRAFASARLAGADRPARAQALGGAWLLLGAVLMLVLLYLFQV